MQNQVWFLVLTDWQNFKHLNRQRGCIWNRKNSGWDCAVLGDLIICAPKRMLFDFLHPVCSDSFPFAYQDFPIFWHRYFLEDGSLMARIVLVIQSVNLQYPGTATPTRCNFQALLPNCCSGFGPATGGGKNERSVQHWVCAWSSASWLHHYWRGLLVIHMYMPCLWCSFQR